MPRVGNLGGHARHRRGRSRGCEPRLREACLLVREVLADDRRGTRVLDPTQLKPWCPAKDRFLIVDCWANFEYFDMHPKGREPGEQVPMPVRSSTSGCASSRRPWALCRRRRRRESWQACEPTLRPSREQCGRCWSTSVILPQCAGMDSGRGSARTDFATCVAPSPQSSAPARTPTSSPAVRDRCGRIRHRAPGRKPGGDGWPARYHRRAGVPSCPRREPRAKERELIEAVVGAAWVGRGGPRCPRRPRRTAGSAHAVPASSARSRCCPSTWLTSRPCTSAWRSGPAAGTCRSPPTANGSRRRCAGCCGEPGAPAAPGGRARHGRRHARARRASAAPGPAD